MARKITISFKETSKDIELYELIASMEDKSSEIKRILRDALRKETISKRTIKEEKEDVNILNF